MRQIQQTPTGTEDADAYYNAPHRDFAVTHAHDYLDSGVKRALNDRFAVGVELISLNVRV